MVADSGEFQVSLRCKEFEEDAVVGILLRDFRMKGNTFFSTKTWIGP
jgi:hypothetical protein